MMTRRACLTAGTAALLAPSALPAAEDTASEFDPAVPLPHKSAFAPLNTTYLNCASQHPVSRGAREAVNRYLEYKSFSAENEYSVVGTYFDVLEKFAQLINADADEVAYVQSTTVGENLVIKALDLQNSGSRIVTDELHYVGSLPTYAQLIDSGTDVVTLRASSDGRIALEQFEQAINDNTRLVTVSLVSMVNGFKHDLKELCRIAHAKGALVYADAIHAIGNMPFDVRKSGVDFCAAASYKWLMGEQGLGFLYVRKDRLPDLQRPWFGHYQLKNRTDLGFPNPDYHELVTDYAHRDGTLGYFAMGSQANIVAALLQYSLDYLLAVGADRIQAYRQPLIDKLQDVLPGMGYASITPRNSGTALASFRHDGQAKSLRNKLHAANITATVAPFHLRISPSVFNDMDDIDRLIRALA